MPPLTLVLAIILKLERFKLDSREQLSNMSVNTSTLEVSNADKSKFTIAEQ